MSTERKQILAMLAEGKIDVDEAEKLLEAVGLSPETGFEEDELPDKKRKNPKFLCVQVEPKDPTSGKGERVNVRVPLMLVKAGIKLGSLLPKGTKAKVGDALQDKGLNIDLGNLDKVALNDLIEGLTETSIEVDDDNEKVRVYCR
jgi:hypothetical protein